MNVLIITGSYPPMKCGVGAYTQLLVRALSVCKGVKVSILTDVHASGVAKNEKADVLAVMKGWGIAQLIKSIRYVKAVRPDVVHIQSPTMGYPGRIPLLLPLFIRLLGIPCVQTWHEPVPGLAGVWMSIGLTSLISVREELLQSLPWATQKALLRTPFFWVPSGCMLPTVAITPEERSSFRCRYASKDSILLIYYGFVAPLKGIEILLEIVNATNSQLLLACDLVSQDNYHRSLLSKIDSMGLSSRISILGFLQDRQLAKHLAVADAVVLPFRDGARECNTTVAGAAAQGTFVVTTSRIHRGYNKEKNIYFSEPGNVAEMINAINQYSGLRNDNSLFGPSWDSIAETHINIYGQLVDT